MIGAQVSISVSENGKNKPQYTLETDLNGEVSLQEFLKWSKSVLIITADEVLKDAQKQGFDKNPVVVVDGKINKPIQQVSPLGQIKYVSRQQVGTIILEAYTALLELSKVKTGRYKDSHYVIFNGTQVATNLGTLNSWLESNPQIKDGDLIRIVNIQPYARKLELLGVTSTRSSPRREDKGRRKGKKTGIIITKPNGAYQLASRKIKAKYKNNAVISFTFLPGTALGISGKFVNAGTLKGRPRKNSAGRPYLYPTLLIRVQEGGTFNV